jgi:hypothetical protein
MAGGLIGKLLVPTRARSRGVFPINEVLENQKAARWPTSNLRTTAGSFAYRGSISNDYRGRYPSIGSVATSGYNNRMVCAISNEGLVAVAAAVNTSLTVAGNPVAVYTAAGAFIALVDPTRPASQSAYVWKIGWSGDGTKLIVLYSSGLLVAYTWDGTNFAFAFSTTVSVQSSYVNTYSQGSITSDLAGTRIAVGRTIYTITGGAFTAEADLVTIASNAGQTGTNGVESIISPDGRWAICSAIVTVNNGPTYASLLKRDPNTNAWSYAGGTFAPANTGSHPFSGAFSYDSKVAFLAAVGSQSNCFIFDLTAQAPGSGLPTYTQPTATMSSWDLMISDRTTLYLGLGYNAGTSRLFTPMPAPGAFPANVTAVSGQNSITGGPIPGAGGTYVGGGSSPDKNWLVHAYSTDIYTSVGGAPNAANVGP